VGWAFVYPDEERLGQALVAVAGLALLAGDREEELRAAIVAGLGPYRTAAGSYRLENDFRILVTRARNGV
jgi:hypothetical protein